MCGNKPSVKADEPDSITPRRTSRSTAETRSSTRSNINIDTSSNASVSSKTSLSSLRNSLPENTHIYDISEIRHATNNFLAKRFSAAPSWRCSLRGKDVVVFQRKFRRPIQESELRDKLSVIYRSHHITIIKLVGASISGDYIYLVYDFVSGGNLSDCLRNKRNPDFTVLSTWMSRMQIATDLASGLDYIHNNAGLKVNLVHKYVKSSSVIVTEPAYFAKICHFGTAELCGETVVEQKVVERVGDDEIVEVEAEAEVKKLTRSGSRTVQFEGVNGYMAPEFRGIVTQNSDVYAFGVVVLELLSGEEPVKYRYDKETGTHVKTLVVETASYAVGGEVSETEGRLRRWVDSRLKDSFPVAVAEKLTRIALDCVEEDPNKRPNMSRVAGKISKLYLDSKKWADTFRVPNDFTSSFAPR
ncbi:lysM domain receptor-like kinase 3 [Bidens hawaiensis]|uniref:lysM domain receptor-like kinase 3 n=1 Tax=Bidens hawaiensis TaxID=980011 RepID=UPI00404ABF40